jgi:hypothetical protein
MCDDYELQVKNIFKCAVILLFCVLQCRLCELFGKPVKMIIHHRDGVQL